MKTIKIDLFKQMLIAGAKSIENEFEYINDLNVFPVPDGDTGSNMKTTVNGAIYDMKDADINDFDTLASNFSRGLLMNARGNSGVIMSQIFRGFMEALKSQKDFVDLNELKMSFAKAKERAYNSVATPIEGTILTIVRVIDEELKQQETFNEIEELFDFVLEIANKTLQKTPEMNATLKEANVVDSGGYGLVCFLSGMTKQLKGEFKEDDITEKNKHNKPKQSNHSLLNLNESDYEEGFGYCSEIIMSIGKKIAPEASEKMPFNIIKYKQELSRIGDSMVVVQDDNLVKVHIHTFTPHKLLQISQKYGEFDKVKFDNMTNQFYEKLERNSPNHNEIKLDNKIKIITTVPTQNFKELLITNHGIEHAIITEDIGSPSIQHFVTEIERSNTNQVLIVTDDSNIILAAEQAGQIVAEKGIMVNVIPARNMFESLIAISYFSETADFKTNSKAMQRAIKKTLSAVISTSIKDISYSHIEVKKDDFIGIVNKKIMSANKDELTVLKETIELLLNNYKKTEICYLYCGVNTSQSVISEVEKYISQKYGVIFDIRYTGQKLYQYYIGVQ